jgi:hypothetical protein
MGRPKWAFLLGVTRGGNRSNGTRAVRRNLKGNNGIPEVNRTYLMR